MSNDEDWGEPRRIPAQRFMPLDVVMFGLDWVSNVLEATDEFVGGVQQLLGSHINMIRDRDRFAADGDGERLLEEGGALAAAKEKLRERVARLEGDVEELETELRGLEAKLAGYTAELKTPMTNGLSGEEEALVSQLGKEVERRRKDMIELSKQKNEVWSFIPLY